MDQINELKNRIFGKKKEWDIYDIYHHLMIHYGWIPFNDFIKMDSSLIDELVKRINKMNEEQNNGGNK